MLTFEFLDFLALCVGYTVFGLSGAFLGYTLAVEALRPLRLGWRWRRFKHLHPLGWRWTQLSARAHAADARAEGRATPERVRRAWRAEHVAGYRARDLGPAPEGLARIMSREWARHLVITRREYARKRDDRHVF